MSLGSRDIRRSLIGWFSKVILICISLLSDRGLHFMPTDLHLSLRRAA